MLAAVAVVFAAAANPRHDIAQQLRARTGQALRLALPAVVVERGGFGVRKVSEQLLLLLFLAMAGGFTGILVSKVGKIGMGLQGVEPVILPPKWTFPPWKLLPMN